MNTSLLGTIVAAGTHVSSVLGPAPSFAPSIELRLTLCLDTADTRIIEVQAIGAGHYVTLCPPAANFVGSRTTVSLKGAVGKPVASYGLAMAETELFGVLCDFLGAIKGAKAITQCDAQRLQLHLLRATRDPALTEDDSGVLLKEVKEALRDAYALCAPCPLIFTDQPALLP